MWREIYYWQEEEEEEDPEHLNVLLEIRSDVRGHILLARRKKKRKKKPGRNLASSWGDNYGSGLKKNLSSATGWGLAGCKALAVKVSFGDEPTIAAVQTYVFPVGVSIDALAAGLETTHVDGPLGVREQLDGRTALEAGSFFAANLAVQHRHIGSRSGMIERLIRLCLCHLNHRRVVILPAGRWWWWCEEYDREQKNRHG
jgi:hypothetical protein